jgi:hypothetical protein
MPTVAELRERAKALRLTGYSTLKKANLEKRVANANAAEKRSGAARGTRAVARNDELRSLSNKKAREDYLRRTVYDPSTKRRVLRAGEKGKAIGGVQTRGMREAIPEKKRSPLRPGIGTPRNAEMRNASALPSVRTPRNAEMRNASALPSARTPRPKPAHVGIRERIRMIEEQRMKPLSNKNMGQMSVSAKKKRVDSASKTPLPEWAARAASIAAKRARASAGSASSRRTPSSSYSSSIANGGGSSKTPTASAKSRASSAGSGTRAMSIVASASSRRSAKSSAASAKTSKSVEMTTPSAKPTNSEKRLLSNAGKDAPRGHPEAMTGSYPSVKSSAKGGSGPAKVAPFARKYESERRLINAMGSAGKAKGGKAASARRWKNISGGIPAPYFSASAAASKVSPRRMGKSCGIFDDKLSRLALPAMSLHSPEFKRRFDASMSQLISPQISVLEEYVKKGELACGTPHLKGVCAPHQLSAYMLARLFASNDPSALGGHRGAFFWHSTGSGKTLTVAAIMAAFYGTGHRIVLSTTLENKQNNSPLEFARLFIEFFPGFVRRVVGKTLEKNDKNVKMLAGALFDTNTGASKPFVIQTLEELENALQPGKFQKYTKIHADVARRQRDGGDFSKGTCLILDETQNVFMPSYKRVAATLMSQAAIDGRGPAPFGNRPLKTFALTATPGGTVPDFLKLLSLVRRTDQAEFSSTDPSQFEGLVSYVNYSPRALFAKINGPVGVGVELPPLYYGILLQKFKGGNKNALGDYKLSKQAGGFIGKTDAGTFWDDLRKSKGVLEVTVQAGRKVVASPKLLEIARRATSMPGKQYVYFQNVSTANAFCGVLRTMKFSEVKGTKVPTAPGKRFVQYHASGQAKPGAVLRGYLNVMKAKENLHGEICKIVVCHGVNYEGLNVPAFRGVHLGEPLFSSFADKQAIGRGARFCGHAGLTGEALSVTVYRYFAEPPKSMTFADVFPGKSGKRWETKFEKLSQSFAGADAAAAAKGLSAVRREHPGINARGFDAQAHAASKAPEVLLRFEESVKSVAIDGTALAYFASSKRPSLSSKRSGPAPMNIDRVGPSPTRAKSVPRSLSAALVSAGKRKENANLANMMKKKVEIR